MKRFAIAALAVVALGAAIAIAQVFTMPPPAGVVVLGCVYQSAPPTLTAGQTGFAQCDSTGHLSTGGGGPTANVAVVSPLGHATADAAAIATVPSATAVFPSSQSGAWTVAANPAPTTTGGLSSYFVQPTASDNHVVIKNGAGQVYGIVATNNSATINYLRLYDAGTGFNGCNSATGLITQIAIPASTSGAGFVDNNTMGIAFATGISICVTSGYATTDTTNATASAMSVSVRYK